MRILCHQSAKQMLMETYIQNLQFFANISWQVLLDAYTIVCAFSTFRLDRIRAKTFFSNFWLLNIMSLFQVYYISITLLLLKMTKPDKIKTSLPTLFFSINDEIINVLLILLIFFVCKRLSFQYISLNPTSHVTD